MKFKELYDATLPLAPENIPTNQPRHPFLDFLLKGSLMGLVALSVAPAVKDIILSQHLEQLAFHFPVPGR